MEEYKSVTYPYSENKRFKKRWSDPRRMCWWWFRRRFNIYWLSCFGGGKLCLLGNTPFVCICSFGFPTECTSLLVVWVESRTKVEKVHLLIGVTRQTRNDWSDLYQQMCRPTLDNLNIHLFIGNNQLPQDTLNKHTKVHDVTCIKNIMQVLSMLVVDFVI